MNLPWYIRFLKWLARGQTPRVIPGRVGEGPYLTRYFLTDRGRETEGINDDEAPKVAKIGPRGGVLGCEHSKWLGGDECFACPRSIAQKRPKLGLYLHNFHRSDDDGELHNHPFKWSVSFVLVGGYSEERRLFDPATGESTVIRRRVRPWSLNWIFASTFHRVDLVAGEAWSLFLVGPLVQDWGFWCRTSDVYTPHREFLDDLDRKRART
jgi:hypothetical protein